MIFDCIGWIFGWSLRLSHNIFHNYLLALFVFLVVSRMLYTVWEVIQNKRSARYTVCAKMIDRCQKEVASHNPDAFVACGEKIYKATKTSAFTGISNGIISFLILAVFLHALTSPITYYFGAKPADITTDTTLSQVEIFEAENAEKLGDGDLAQEMQNEKITIAGHSVFAAVTMNDWTACFPFIILLLQVAGVIGGIKTACDRENSTKKRIFAVLGPVIVMVMMVASVFILPLYIALEFIIFRTGSILFVIIFRKFIAPRYKPVLDTMNEQCLAIIEEGKNEVQADTVTNGEVQNG